MNNYKQVIKELQNLNESDQVRPKIIELHKNGGSIVQCVKLYRELTGSSLRDSVDYVKSII